MLLTIKQTIIMRKIFSIILALTFSAGTVFAADGSRFDTDIYSVGEYGYYQSATMVHERNDDYSFYFYFYNEKAAVDKDYTCYGCSVRLVK